MENKNTEIRPITLRMATDFGFHLADEFRSYLTEEKLTPSQWPEKLPLSLKEVMAFEETNKNRKISQRALKSARLIWTDMRNEALEVEKDMKLHPEYYEMFQNESNEQEKFEWRNLSIDIEQSAGNLYITTFGNEDLAKKNVYKLLSARSLKKYMLEFEDDFKNFADEIREKIRSHKIISASTRLEMICMLNANSQAAQKLLGKI